MVLTFYYNMMEYRGRFQHRRQGQLGRVQRRRQVHLEPALLMMLHLDPFKHLRTDPGIKRTSL